MKPPALSITITLPRPGEGWHYTARKWGEPVGCSDGDIGFEQPGPALAAALADIKATFAPSKEGGDDA